MTTRKANRNPTGFNHLTGRFEYSEAQHRRMQADHDAHMANIRAKHAAEAGMTLEQYEARDIFAEFEGH